jgi:hypothetical protein
MQLSAWTVLGDKAQDVAVVPPRINIPTGLPEHNNKIT